jgi:hypothetical protein
MQNLLDAFRFVPLTNDLLNTSRDFDCGHLDLNDFFKTNSYAFSKQLLGKTYCFTSEESPPQIFSTAEQEKSFFDMPLDSVLSTRLMFFDLLFLTTRI